MKKNLRNKRARQQGKKEVLEGLTETGYDPFDYWEYGHDFDCYRYPCRMCREDKLIALEIPIPEKIRHELIFNSSQFIWNSDRGSMSVMVEHEDQYYSCKDLKALINLLEARASKRLAENDIIEYLIHPDIGIRELAKQLL